MYVAGRRKSAIFFLILGICLVAVAVALYVGWILLNLQQIALLILGIVFFSLIITGLVLNTSFLLREIRRNEQHDAFLNAVTHELKTPIASIRLYLETLKSREIAPEKQREFYNVMLADSDRLLSTVEQVLLASSTREKNRQLNLSAVDVTTLLRQCIDRISTRYNLDEGAITFSPAGDAKIMGDSEELQIVFTNLLDNAVKYSGADIKVGVRVNSLREKRVEVLIKDSGAGIPQPELKRIFKRFYRVPGIAGQTAKGTGLGLFIVASIVKKHRGKIWAKSKGVGKGATFVVQMPKA
jgi:two-component system, OmpR family, sensor histidine kinase SenX3